MSIKLKALSLGLLAVVATSAFAVMNAGATVSGHFVTGSEHTFITGIEKETHKVHFVSEPGAKQLGCDVAQYTGTHKGTKTTTELTITPKWEKCQTTGGTEAKFDVHENGCYFVFTSRAGENDATVHVKCPPGNKIVITHPNCDIGIPEQTVGGVVGNGVTYTNQGISPEQWVTMDIKVSGIVATYENKICLFLGTNHNTAIMEGSVTVTGFSNAAHTVRTNITAT